MVFENILNIPEIWFFLNENKEEIIRNIKNIGQMQIHESPKVKSKNPFNQKIEISVPFFREQRIYNPICVSVQKEMPAIQEFINNNGITISSDFFYTGNLIREGVIRSDLKGDFSLLTLEGSESEKEKYHSLWILNDLITHYNEVENGFNQLAHYHYLSLVLSNNGTLADEDIEVKIFLPKDSLIQIDEFPIKEYLKIDDEIISLESIISEIETHDIKEYVFPKSHYLISPSLIFQQKEDSDKIKEEFESMNFYNTYNSDDNIILVFKFEKLNHNFNMFFPCRLFFVEKFTNLDFEIRSKNIPEVISGKLINKE